MEYDAEKERAAREEERRKDREEFAALCADLEHIIANPDFDIPMLDRQATILDCITYTLLRRNLRRDKKNACIDHDNLAYVLRVQKQCVDTLKAAAAIDYMDSVRCLSTGIYPPRYQPALAAPKPLAEAGPPKHDERTIKFELSDGSHVEL